MSDLQRALAVSRGTLIQQLRESETGTRDAGGTWRTWRRSEVATMALERALITAGLAASAARTVAADVLGDDPFTAAAVKKSWLVIVAKPDRWVWGMVRRLDGVKGETLPWPMIVVHPRTVVKEALDRLDSDDDPEIAAAQPVTRRPAMPSQLRADGRGEFRPEAFA